MLKCLTKTLKIVTELVKGVQPSLSFAKEVVKASYKCQERLDKIVVGGLATEWSSKLCVIYVLTTEYCGRRVNLDIE